MLRNGTYAIYKGYEYGINGDHLFFWEDEVDEEKKKEGILEGFVEVEVPGNYERPITQSEVTEVYRIRTYAIYQGRKFGVWQERNNGQEYLINYMDNSIEDKEYLNSAGFHMLDSRGMEYEKWIPKEEIEKLFEEKQHARYFEAKEPIGGNGSIEFIVLYEKKAQ